MSDPGLFWFGFGMGALGIIALLLIAKSVALWLFARDDDDDRDPQQLIVPTKPPKPTKLRVVKGGKK